MISYSKDRKAEIRRYKAVIGLGLMPAFKKSKYSTYGWFLKSIGITITDSEVYTTNDCPFRTATIEEVLADE